MKNLLLALAASLFACAAAAATLPATPATLDAAFAKAAITGGDVIALAPGAYGDVWIGPKRFAGKTTLTCADPASPPSLRSINIRQTSNLTVSCVRVDFTPDASTVTFTPAVKVSDSDHIDFSGVKIVGGNAISGVAETAAGLDGTGNVIGRPTAYGLQIANSSFIAFDRGEVARFHKGVVLQTSTDIKITASDLHDMRTTAIVGGGVSRILIDGNKLHDAAPWNWGKGDHADFIAMWTVPGQVGPSDDIRITNNSFSGGSIMVDGVAQPGVLGGWLQGQTTAFTNTVWSGNRFELANLQAIAFWNVQGGSIDNNVMVRIGAADPKQAPSILLRDGVTGIALTKNTLNAISDTSGGVNPQSGNILIPGGVLPAPPPIVVAPPTPPTPVPAPPAPTPAPAPQPAPAPVPALAPVDVVISLLKGQTFATSKPGKTYKLAPGQRAIITAPK